MGEAGSMSTPADPHVVAITAGHSFGHRILRRFEEVGIRLDLLIVTVQQNTPRESADRGTRARLARARARLRAWWRGWRQFRRVARRIVAVDSLRDDRARRELVRARAGVLVLAGTGIVPSELLSIPSQITLNAHPGLLPWVRGVCPLEHAVLRGVPLGVTVHAVDAGIDTGPIVQRALLPLTAEDGDRIELTRRLEDRAIEALTDVVARLTLHRQAVRMHAQSSRHPYGGWVSDEARARAVDLLRNGEAARLSEQWRRAAGGDVLPMDDERLPRPAR